MHLRSLVCLVLLIPFASHSAFCQQAKGDSSSDGAAIFSQRCAQCHGDKGQGISALESIAGPSIQAEHNPGVVMTALEVGPSHMPRFEYVLSVQDMRAVAHYVTTQIAVIPLANGNLQQGGELFRIYCASCHRTAVRGGALAFTGVNAPALTTKSPALIAGAIRWGPGPMPSFPATVLDDQKLASIVRYVTFVQHPPDPGGSPMHYYGPVAEGLVAWVIVLLAGAVAVWIEKGGNG
jgi:ubiquinol-cytochrome c reductase cytochrome c subunit